MGLEDAFNQSAERIKTNNDVTDQDKLEIYALFKQANLGDCTTSAPGGLFNMKEKAKWNAYNGKKGMSKEDAMKAYVAKVDELCGTSFSSEI